MNKKLRASPFCERVIKSDFLTRTIHFKVGEEVYATRWRINIPHQYKALESKRARASAINCLMADYIRGKFEREPVSIGFCKNFLDTVTEFISVGDKGVVKQLEGMDYYSIHAARKYGCAIARAEFTLSYHIYRIVTESKSNW